MSRSSWFPADRAGEILPLADQVEYTIRVRPFPSRYVVAILLVYGPEALSHRQAHVTFVISWWLAEETHGGRASRVVSMVDSHHGRRCDGRSIKQSRSDESSLRTARATRMARRPQATTNRVQPQATSLRRVPGARPVRWFRRSLGGLHGGRRGALHVLRDALHDGRRQRHPRSDLLRNQRALRGLLGASCVGSLGGFRHKSDVHPRSPSEARHLT